MGGRATTWRLAGELGWLFLSTALFIVLAAQEASSTWRTAWLVLLTVNVAVVALRIRRLGTEGSGA